MDGVYEAEWCWDGIWLTFLSMPTAAHVRQRGCRMLTRGMLVHDRSRGVHGRELVLRPEVGRLPLHCKQLQRSGAFEREVTLATFRKQAIMNAKDSYGKTRSLGSYSS